jgi:hypothetical protein
MKLNSTLSPISKAGPACGDLHLFFSLFNPDDSYKNGTSQFWNCSNKGAVDTYNLQSGDSVSLQLDLQGDQIPGQLHIIGAIRVTLAGRSQVGPQLILSQTPQPFVSNKPQIALLSGKSEFNDGSVNYQMGFFLSVAWDGQSADCQGRWWACWQ